MTEFFKDPANLGGSTCIALGALNLILSFLGIPFLFMARSTPTMKDQMWNGLIFIGIGIVIIMLSYVIDKILE